MTMQSMSARRSLLNNIGIAVLLIGVATGEFLYWRSQQRGDTDEDNSAEEQMYNSRTYTREVQMNGGTLGLLMDQWTRAAGKLGQPKPLAITIMVVSALSAGACFAVAAKMQRDGE